MTQTVICKILFKNMRGRTIRNSGDHPFATRVEHRITIITVVVLIPAEIITDGGLCLHLRLVLVSASHVDLHLHILLFNGCIAVA